MKLKLITPFFVALISAFLFFNINSYALNENIDGESGDSDYMADSSDPQYMYSAFNGWQGLIFYFVNYDGTMLDNSFIFIDQYSDKLSNVASGKSHLRDIVGDGNLKRYCGPRFSNGSANMRYYDSMTTFNADLGLSMTYAYWTSTSNYSTIKSVIQSNDGDGWNAILNACYDGTTNLIFPNSKSAYDTWKASSTRNDDESIYLCVEPVYWFMTPKPNGGSKFWYGTTIGYSTKMNTEYVNNTDAVATSIRSGISGDNGIYTYGYWWSRKYTNGLYGTFICTSGPQLNLGITTAGNTYDGDDGMISYASLMDKSVVVA